MTDQHQAEYLGRMGNRIIQTPHPDSLSAAGFTFENAFCQSPVCMASPASHFTGLYPSTIKVPGMGILPPQKTTLPEMLKRHGYRTAAFGKAHLTPEQYTRYRPGSDVPALEWKRFAADACLWPVPAQLVRQLFLSFFDGGEEGQGNEDLQNH